MLSEVRLPHNTGLFLQKNFNFEVNQQTLALWGRPTSYIVRHLEKESTVVDKPTLWGRPKPYIVR